MKCCGVYSRPSRRKAVTLADEEREKQVREQISTEQGNVASGTPGSRGAAIAMYGVLLLAYSVNAADRQLFPLLANRLSPRAFFP